MRNSGPFYLAMKERPKTLGWYKWPGMGINNINSFMKNMEQVSLFFVVKFTLSSRKKRYLLMITYY